MASEPAVDRMAPVLECLPGIFQPSDKEAGSDEYLGRDGLIHCSICGEPREARITLFGNQVKVSAACRCQNTEYEIMKQRSEEEIHRNAIRSMESTLYEMGVSMRYEHTFRDVWDEADKYVAKARKYADHFDLALEKNVSLLMTGAPGCGKTFLAECIANQIEDSGRAVFMTNVQKVADGIRRDYGEAKPFIMSRIRASDLLILDDFGTERDTSYMSEIVFDVINERYLSRKPFVITTNLTTAEIMSEKDMRYRRIYDRILETAVPMEIKGTSKRRICASRNREYWDEIFE